MKHLAAIVLLLVYGALGTGAAEYAHNLQHLREDAAAGETDKQAPHHHDDSNCQVHAMLHTPLLVAAWVPLLVCLGLLVAFLTQIITPLVGRLVPARIDCRGPPSC